MEYILNENEYAESMIESHDLGDNPTATLTMIARLFRGNGSDKRAIRQHLEEHLLRADPDVVLPFWTDTINRIVQEVDRRKPVAIDRIIITEPEIARINTLDSVQIQRVAFALLCLAKYWDARFESTSHLVHTPHIELFRLANVSTSLDRRCMILRRLRDCGMITYRKYFTDLRVSVNYIEDGAQAMCVTDMRNLGYQYMALNESGYMECESCGLVIRKKTNNQRYCPECADREHQLRSAELMREKRRYAAS